MTCSESMRRISRNHTNIRTSQCFEIRFSGGVVLVERNPRPKVSVYCLFYKENNPAKLRADVAKELCLPPTRYVLPQGASFANAEMSGRKQLQPEKNWQKTDHVTGALEGKYENSK